jgi:hypothetical protein
MGKGRKHVEVNCVKRSLRRQEKQVSTIERRQIVPHIKEKINE